MKLMHAINVVAWLANSAVWAIYAHSVPMSAAAITAAVFAGVMFMQADA